MRSFYFLISTIMTPYDMLSLDELHDKFCAEAQVIKSHTPATIKWYRTGLKNLKRFKKFETCRQITELDLTEFFFWGRQELGWCEKSMSTHYGALSSFFSWCVKKQILAVNPIKGVPRPKIPKQLPKALTKEEARRLLEYVQYMPVPKTYEPQLFYKHRDVAIIAMLMFTGLRRQELIDLKVMDVNLLEDQIMIRCGKGMKDRLVPISFELKRLLQRYVQEREAQDINSAYFFCSPGRHGRIGVKTLTRLFCRIREGTGIHFSAHKLRHTFATLMVQSKCDIFSLSKMMGHSDIRTTNIYLSTTTSHLKEQVNNHPLNFV